ncbi:MAG TPA: glycosyltransferase [Candidatus Dormibacteraeota bacterium]|nr:glycosyltransferase [Candidatus Dormibacteraeota bacterium]
MATQTAQFVHDRAAPRSERPLVVCHCTIAHTELKSRSYHRQLLPLAETGVAVRYLAPMRPSALARGIDVVELGRPANLLQRVFAWPALLAKLVRQRAAIYHIQDPQLLPVAFVLKVVFRKRIVYDAYEDFPSIAAGKKSVPAVLRSTAAAVVALAEKFAARFLDAIITADPLTLRRFVRQRKSRKLVFYNFPNLNFFPPPRPHHASFDLLYRGGLSERTGTYVLLDALRLLAARRNPPRLLLIGYFDDPRSEEALRQRMDGLGLGGLIEIRGRVAHERMANAISEARIGISPLLPVRKFRLNIPVKIFEYWACGLPVVATDLAPMRPFFRDGEAGLLVPPASATRLAGSIAHLLDHPDEAACMGRRGRALVSQRFNNVTEVQKLSRLFASIASKSNQGRPPR